MKADRGVENIIQSFSVTAMTGFWQTFIQSSQALAALHLCIRPLGLHDCITGILNTLGDIIARVSIQTLSPGKLSPVWPDLSDFIKFTALLPAAMLVVLSSPLNTFCGSDKKFAASVINYSH